MKQTSTTTAARAPWVSSSIAIQDWSTLMSLIEEVDLSACATDVLPVRYNILHQLVLANPALHKPTAV